LFKETQKIEHVGGMMIKNGARRRTPGGVFLHLLRQLKDPLVDPKKASLSLSLSIYLSIYIYLPLGSGTFWPYGVISYRG
jgi:hypothetical protein